MVHDRPGVLAEVARIFAAAEVSIESVLQRGRAPGSIVPLILTTHDTDEAAMSRVRKQLASLPNSAEDPSLIRIEAF